MNQSEGEQLQLRIHGMDCAEEVSLLKRELLPLLGDEDRLGFDLLNGKLTVDTSSMDVTLGDVLAAIERTGLKSELWQDGDYSGYSNPPTYGPHHPFRLDAQRNAITPRPTGVYETEQPDEDMVHGLEHGHVWISYNPSLISSSDLSDLRQFVIDGGTDTGVIMTPRAANDDAIAVASWARLLTLDNFDASAIRTFIESNRGKSDGEGFIPSGQKTDDAGSENLDDGLPH